MHTFVKRIFPCRSDLKAHALNNPSLRYLCRLWEDHSTGADKGLISVDGAAECGVYSVVIASACVFDVWK